MHCRVRLRVLIARVYNLSIIYLNDICTWTFVSGIFWKIVKLEIEYFNLVIFQHPTTLSPLWKRGEGDFFEFPKSGIRGMT